MNQRFLFIQIFMFKNCILKNVLVNYVCKIVNHFLQVGVVSKKNSKPSCTATHNPTTTATNLNPHPALLLILTPRSIHSCFAQQS